MGWPYHNDTELNRAGYKFDRMGICRGKDCSKKIEWWLTPKDKWMPLDPGTMEPHWTTCPNQKDFRK